MNTFILKTIQTALESSGCGVFVLSGADNMRYASGTHLPFTDQHPGLAFVILIRDVPPRVLCPALWASSWKRGGIASVHGYTGSPTPEHAAAELAGLLRTFEITSIGADLDRAPEVLCRALSAWKLEDISSRLLGLRQVKNVEETALLEDLAYRADHAILGATHHSLACDVRAEKGQAELIRIHALERGFEAVGYNGISQSATGVNARKFWPESPKFGVGQGKKTARGEINRLDLQASLNGYWAFGSRLMIMGRPSREQTRIYNGLVAMREAALAAVRAGAVCSDLYAAMLEAASGSGVEPVTGIHWGHSIGVCSREAPYITPDEKTPLRENMVLVLNPHVVGPDGEILYSRDTVLVNFNGCKILGWYKDWREPYMASDSYYSGGG